MRANLLRWATLTPDLGVEWRISPSVGILVNGSWTSWTSWPSRDWRNSQPRKGDARRYFKAGQFNYRFSGTGRQGDLLGGGITGGYQLRLTDALDMPERRYGEVRCDRRSAGAQRQRDEALDRPDQRRSEHIKNIYEQEELEASSTVRDFRTVRQEGGRQVARIITYYNLDAIISIGFRVNTKRGIQFRQWANKVLKEYLLKGYSLTLSFDSAQKKMRYLK